MFHFSYSSLVTTLAIKRLYICLFHFYYSFTELVTRDVVLEASASARGSFLAGSASHGLASVSTLLPLPRLCLIVSASVWIAPCLGSVVISQLKRASAHGAQNPVKPHTEE